MGQSQAVHPARHVNVREQASDIPPGFKNGESFVSIGSLYDFVAGLHEHIHDEPPHQDFVFDDEYDRRARHRSGARQVDYGHPVLVCPADRLC